ncbi:hypothetical protein D3C81_1246210 [compost metagenome]
MIDDLGNLRRLDAVIQGQIQVVSQFDGLLFGNQHREGDQTAVTPRQPWAFPDLPEQHRFGVMCQGRRHRAHVVQVRNGGHLSGVVSRMR